MKILLINQFIPPDPAPTSRLLEDLAAELRTRGHDVFLLGGRSDYRGSKTLLGSRLLRELLSLAQLFLKGCLHTGCDRLVCMSSPPMLPAVALALRLRHRRAKLVQWAMDLYPDIAVALGEIRAGSAVERLASSLMAAAYRSSSQIIVLDQDMAARVARHGVACSAVPPWPRPLPPASRSGGTGSATAGGGAFTWLYSGNLGRAHEWRTILLAQRILEMEGGGFRLVFQGGGAEREPAQRFASEIGLGQCEWLPYVPEEDLVDSLLGAGCLVASMRPEAQGCLWPSKLSLGVLLGRPILWIGTTSGSIADFLRQHGHLCFAQGDAAGVALALRKLHGARSEKDSDHSSIERNIDQARDTGIKTVANLVLED